LESRYATANEIIGEEIQMNKGLRYVLEVYRSVRQQHLSRVDAAKNVGNANRITYETVMASCTRGLNISTDQFDYYLEPESTVEFKNFLIKRFPNFQDQIDEFFCAFDQTSDDTGQDISEKIVRPLFQDEKKSLFNQLMLNSFREKFQDWTARKDLPIDVREQLKDWLKKI
jgi:hypothetical protein